MENLVIVMFPDTNKMSLIGKKENIENKQSKHGEEINEASAGNSLCNNEDASGHESEKGDEEKDDKLAGGVAHGGERGRDNNRHGVESAAGNNDEERDEIVAERNIIKQLKDWDAEEPGSK